MKNPKHDSSKGVDSQNNKNKKEKEEEIDEQLEQTFPASDPPSYSQPGNDLEEKKKK